ncbi:arylsulfatase B [Parasteatoda tepidariorum]|uniref:arylsulfatase B n=1 Tax=Parasteatoda tepidariorum TaxID=114398 RepID=UPI001C722572|nr:arylsulfatase I [Parasteatoda tepidariorum]XP_015930740.2 arylsulfatase I [Parasteatoda tepidariorum]
MKHLIIFVSFICFATEVVFSKQPPHIIFIIIDDLGWNDVSFHGSKQIPTPNIDAIAQDGIILNNYYVQPICTPSRGALMTGKYPLRLGLQHDVIYAEAPWGLSPEEKILPQYLKELGYETHGVGKWHLGYFHESYLPVNRGFDSFFGYWNGKEDHFTHWEEGQGTHGLDLHDDNVNAWNYTGKYSTELFTEKAKTIIHNHDTTKPLFLYLAHQAVHAGNSYAPLQAPQEYVQRFSHIKDPARRSFAGMTSALDDSIGDLFENLNKAGILSNSVIVFTTDNGGAVQGIDESTGSNWPLRGSKYNMWEGGVRGVAFVWSPELRQAKERISSHMMHISDWLPTLYSVAGGDKKKLGKIDGYNQWKALCCSDTGPRQSIIHNIDPKWNVESVRKGKYKLVKGSVFDGTMDGWFDKEGKREVNVPFTSEELEEQTKVYNQLWKKSKISSILSKMYGETINENNIADYCVPETEKCHSKSAKKSKNSEDVKSHKSPLEVQCGPRPENSSTNCKPMEAACLFDIIADPCEYNNLAAMKPEILKDLEGELDKYRVQAAPVRNQPMDPMSNPKYHGYAWIPWKKSADIH